MEYAPCALRGSGEMYNSARILKGVFSFLASTWLYHLFELFPLLTQSKQEPKPNLKPFGIAKEHHPVFHQERKYLGVWFVHCILGFGF